MNENTNNINVDENTAPVKKSWIALHPTKWWAIKKALAYGLCAILFLLFVRYFNNTRMPTDKQIDQAYDWWCQDNLYDFSEAFGCDRDEAQIYLDWLYKDAVVETYIEDEKLAVYTNCSIRDEVLWQFSFEKSSTFSPNWELVSYASDNYAIYTFIEARMYEVMNENMAEAFTN